MDDNIFDLSIKRNEKEIQECLRMSREVDKIIVDYVNSGMDSKLVAGVVADSLGRFLREFSQREKLWTVLLNTIKKKANIK